LGVGNSLETPRGFGGGIERSSAPNSALFDVRDGQTCCLSAPDSALFDVRDGQTCCLSAPDSALLGVTDMEHLDI
jgi:hypothetical protein